jgi:carbamate kinase
MQSNAILSGEGETPPVNTNEKFTDVNVLIRVDGILEYVACIATVDTLMLDPTYDPVFSKWYNETVDWKEEHDSTIVKKSTNRNLYQKWDDYIG